MSPLTFEKLVSAALLCEACALRDLAKIFQAVLTTLTINTILPKTQELF